MDILGNVERNEILTTTESSSLLTNTSEADATLVCLNFKVPLGLRKKFKIYAARHNLTMTEMLIQLLNQRFESDLARE